MGSARQSVRRLIELGVFRLVERSKAGHVIEVRLPDEIRAARPGVLGENNGSQPGATVNLEEIDFMQTKALRQAIHAREQGRCFYCLRRVKARMRCLDHVVPLAELGSNSYRNLVSCCPDCNVRKRDLPAEDFLRQLFREGRLSQSDLSAQLQALRDLAAGNLRPVVAGL